MTKREEVHKLYKDFIELFNEQEHKFKSYKADYSNEMNNVLKVFELDGFDATITISV